MPESKTQINKAGLQESMREMDFSAPPELNQAEKDYSKFYRLDLENKYDKLKHGFGYIEVDHQKIASHSFLMPQAAGTAFVCHGYFDHVGLYDHLIKKLISLNFNVVAWDLPGHGLSTGEHGVVDTFDEYEDSLKAVLSKAEDVLQGPWHLIGQSTGAAIIMDYLLNLKYNHSKFKSVILLAPLYQPKEWTKGKIKYFLAKHFIKFIKREDTSSSHDEEFLEFVNSDPLRINNLSLQWIGALISWQKDARKKAPSDKKIVVIQGKKDKTVDWEKNLKFVYEKFPNHEVHYVSDAEHHLVNEREDIRNRIFELIEETLSS